MGMLDTSIKFLSGIGPKRSEILQKEIEVSTYDDLLHYFPYKYVDRSRFYSISEIEGTSSYIQLKGHFLSFQMMGGGPKMRMNAVFADETGTMKVTWFHGLRFVVGKYNTKDTYTLFGKPTFFSGQYSMAHPEVEVYAPDSPSQAGLQPFYNTTEKMKTHFINSKVIQKTITSLFSLPSLSIQETLPASILQKKKLVSLAEALHDIHFPTDISHLKEAEYRLKYEELFYIQLNLLGRQKQRNRATKGFCWKKTGQYLNEFYKEHLPFELTNAQKRVVKEIYLDMGSGYQMNRLVQGDVGSGKTLVALLSMLIAIGNGYQTCLMAPTEILSEQHYHSLSRFLQGMGLNVELLTGSTKKKKRIEIAEGLQNGEIHILVGTHALLEENVCFQNLGLAVIDEQHRFGVRQRSMLWKKNVIPPHVLVMTATPIPRTLAMTLYGDLEVSIIDELPPGRKPIETIHFYQSREMRLYASIRKKLDEGRQIYFVYPLIEESEAFDYQNLMEGYEHIKSSFPHHEVGMLHGRMKPDEKEEVMQKFSKGEINILVSTTVIEVGVDVPNATIMVIENAEHFGLSQLHQLRGRVGRGEEQSYCILLTGSKLSEETRKRIEIMVETNDGFRIAEEDLKLRGPGDLEGTQQSGIAFKLRIANLSKDFSILEEARKDAEELLEEDMELANPENQILKQELQRRFYTGEQWGRIS